MQKHVYQTGLIGNCAYLAHVHTNTNITWMCWPRFDSSFIFGSMLDEKKGGEFSLQPYGKYTSRQYYTENTNVLCTEITCEEGKYRITDFAPRFHQYERYFRPLMLVRKIEPLEGTPRVRAICKPVAKYGERRLQPHRGSSHIDFHGMDETVRLTTNIPISYLLEEQFVVLNETKYLVLTYGSPLEAPLESTAEDFLRKTIAYWRRWVKHTTIAEFYQQEVIRSALVLKIHQYEDTGAIIAASTTSLPEYDQSGRTWDYRFCWLRDTFYVLTAFNHIGHFEEMERYFHYMADISVRHVERYQPLYTVTGGDKLDEKFLDLEGYLGNQPVRIGNQASEHIQNDIYGQVIISLLPLYVDKRFALSERTDSYNWISNNLRKMERLVNEADAGLWEFRNLSQVHCYTNLFHWAGASAAYKIACFIKNEDLKERALKLQKQASANIEKCYDKERKVYTQAIGTDHLDASTLQLIMMHYLDPASEKAQDHLRGLEKELKAPGGLFYRYKHVDDFGKPESTFLISAFWYVEALACVGRLDEAMDAFDNLLKYSNHVGLFSEDVHHETGSQWGNFPQAYSHVGLMNAAYRIARKLDRPNFF